MIRNKRVTLRLFYTSFRNSEMYSLENLDFCSSRVFELLDLSRPCEAIDVVFTQRKNSHSWAIGEPCGYFDVCGRSKILEFSGVLYSWTERYLASRYRAGHRYFHFEVDA